MSTKLAIDWDESELRIVAANCSGPQVVVTDAAVLAIESDDVFATLRSYVAERGLEKTESLVAIGRGKAELRELQLPPVPDEELPDIVRFQAIRNFASSGDSATIDFLITDRTEQGVKAIAAAVSPSTLAQIKEVCGDAQLHANRIALRPLASAGLFLSRAKPNVGEGDSVLIDLLNDDAEIIVVRDGNVIFVRTVRMPSSEATRPRALVNELRRSLMACGASGKPNQVVLWGRESVHRSEIEQIAEATGSKIDVVNPFDLVEVKTQVREKLPEHVGRLAPLVGLLVCDEVCPERLIDFLNPRERLEESPDHRRTVAMVGVPVLVAILLLFFGYRHLSGLDQQIESLSSGNTGMKESVDQALASRATTQKIDEFLDGDAVWVRELRELAERLPPSDKVMLRSIFAASDPRSGVSTLTITGSAVSPAVIEELEESIRDENHRVVGEGASEQDSPSAYQWVFTEKISIQPEYAYSQRYKGIKAASEAETLAPEQNDAEQNDAEQNDAEQNDAEQNDAEQENAEQENTMDADVQIVSPEVQS
ncbi:Competence protein A [Planctomycetes bacterium CA13]|uniref:Competence protein A n=1 Tax=Novipirellula herctigrandis TaxID=2527986 RepID=A0A5C5Z9D5_9BACT|nr:Competence protein A [Planctomycetes bacterium CA13]